MQRRTRRGTAPKPVRQVAHAARLSLRKLAEAVIAGQPPPERPRDQAALLGWLGQSVRNTHPGAARDELAQIMAAQLREMADGGDPTAQTLLDAEFDERRLKVARIELVLAGARWAPDPPELLKQQRMDSIAATVLEITRWTSVDTETVEAIYGWLFGDEALFVVGAEMRLEAGLQMLENPALREVRVPHPDTGEMVLVTRQEMPEHGEAAHRVLEAAERYTERQMRWHDRLIRALRPYGDQHERRGRGSAGCAGPGHRAGRAELRGVRRHRRGGCGGAAWSHGGVSAVQQRRPTARPRPRP